MKLGYPFSEADAEAATNEWGCNCGPAALAFALQVGLDAVRPLIPDFDAKRYTSPSMMAAALDASGRRWSRTLDNGGSHQMFSQDYPTLVRIQWTGPWTAPGSNPRWAYRQTHWICAWADGDCSMIFDINGGIRTLQSWEVDVVPPLLASCVKRADGGWHSTHCWPVFTGEGA